MKQLLKDIAHAMRYAYNEFKYRRYLAKVKRRAHLDNLPF